MKAEESKNVARIAITIMQMYQTLKEVLNKEPDKFNIAAQGYIDSLEAMKHYDIIEDYSLDSGEINTKGCFSSTPTPYQEPGLIATLGGTPSQSGSIKEPTPTIHEGIPSLEVTGKNFQISIKIT
jgi:hypothetical protein